MKKRIRWMLAGVMLLLLTACSDAGPVQKEGQEKLGQSSASTEKAGLEQSSTANGEAGLEQPSASTGEDGTAQTPVPTEAEVLSGLSRPVGKGGSAVSLQGAVLENLTVVGEDNEYYCNLEANVKGKFSRQDLEYPVLVCKDPVYDITYYVNYGRDYFIYAKRGDVTQKVLEIPAKDLFCRQGILYFRTDSYDRYEFDSFTEGAVLAYDPTDGSVEVVIDKPVYEMVVYPDGITYFEKESTMSEDGTKELSFSLWRYFYSFESGETVGPDWPQKTLTRWKENSLVIGYVEEDGRKKAVYRLETPEGEVIAELTGLNEALESRRTNETGPCYLEAYCVRGDCIYYVDSKNDCLLCYDMGTGEETTVVELAEEVQFEKAYIVQGGAAYFDSAIKYSFVLNKQYKVKLRGMTQARIQNFYTDGEDIYVLADGKLWLYEEVRTDGSGVLVSSYALPGRMIVREYYEGILHPLGE